ncbi:hypothetical protein PQX77_009142 [Marasmius sp. AFHP31]|nr:hypothetical protein PQX77_009142 [Marasmius sp. AFHP31]
MIQSLASQLQHRIFGFLGFKSRALLALAGNSSLTSNIRAYVRHMYNIDIFLSPHFTFPNVVKQFRNIQAETQTIIGGSTARRFFDRDRTPSILKLFVLGWRSQPLLRFLENAGYKNTSAAPVVVYESVSALISFSKAGSPDIHVYLTMFSLFLPILEHPDSADMAFITATEAFHLYPNTCLEFRESVENGVGQTSSEDPDKCAAIEKAVSELHKDVEGAGYGLYFDVTDRENRRGLMPEEEVDDIDSKYSEFRLSRAAGDDRTMILQLDQDGLSGSQNEFGDLSTIIRQHSWNHLELSPHVGLQQEYD